MTKRHPDSERRKQVAAITTEHFGLAVGYTVRARWGGQVSGHRPRTKRGEIIRLYNDGSFRAKCDKTGRCFNGRCSDVIEVIR